MKKTFLIIFYLFTGYSFGQNFQLIHTSDTKEREKLVTYFKNKHDEFNNNIKQTYKGQMRKEIMDFYQSSQTSVLEIIASKKLLFDMRFQNYLDSLYLNFRF